MSKRHFFVILTLLFWSPISYATLKLPMLLSDGAVLQRDKPLTLWGWAAPNEIITVTLNHKHFKGQANAQGQWSIQIPANGAGGPHELQIHGRSERLRVQDIYFGDVWLASGQSNMELPIRRVLEKYPELGTRKKFPLIRQFLVPKAYDFHRPHEDYSQVAWQAANPENIQNFSAVAYFFAEALLDKLDVPIGIINSSYGGSPVQSWMSEQALASFPEHLSIAHHFRHPESIKEVELRNKKREQQWHKDADAQDKGMQSVPPWYVKDGKDEDWQPIYMPGYWYEQGEPFQNGVLWLRKRFYLNDNQAAQTAILRLGSITDADQTYINGELVGNTTYQYPPRIYRVPEEVLRSGENSLVVRVLSHRGHGGFVPDKPYELRLAGENIDLSGEWHYRIGTAMPALAHSEFIAWKPLGLFNGMLAPATRFSIKGVIWYQGESNTDAPENYSKMFNAMVRDWRQQWQQPELPIIFVQLSALNPYHGEPVQSNWAALRQQQLESLKLKNIAMAVSFDLGEWNDIHPLEKKRLGQRMALAARYLAYGERNLVYSGPLFDKLSTDDSSVLISFTEVGSGLTAFGESLTGFTLAGKDGKFAVAQARIEGHRVRVWSKQVKDPAKVRYGWQDNPQDANLYNQEGLPASPFEVDIAIPPIQQAEQ
ncbi:sialate O-acetylesterase [Bowmanella yangjiangensis]|uniref:Acetyl esterase n=1 Tax=Bowmanella yangjiangensis TaxID=2811230 RepID=A0ABS3CPD0_9ALTE|nr:sialate O-acetylesterase [Bowmanella yangjiangensis]MBN7818946.1 acetyl esterase [Bowmanella yangjiangensis]